MSFPFMLKEAFKLYRNKFDLNASSSNVQRIFVQKHFLDAVANSTN